jgi:hypothetical protein
MRSMGVHENKRKIYFIPAIKLTTYSGTRLIRHTKGPGKCVGMYRLSKYSGFIMLTEIP